MSRSIVQMDFKWNIMFILSLDNNNWIDEVELETMMKHMEHNSTHWRLSVQS